MNPTENDAAEFYTVNAYGEITKHKLVQLELPLRYPGTPKGAKAAIRQVDSSDDIAEDLDDQDSETEAVICD